MSGFKIKASKFSIWYALIQCALLLPALIVIQLNNMVKSEEWRELFGLLLIIHFMIYFITLKHVKAKFFSLTTILYIFYAIFNFGIAICEGLSYKAEEYYAVDNLITPLGEKNYYLFSVFCYLVLLLMETGSLNTEILNSNKIKEIQNREVTQVYSKSEKWWTYKTFTILLCCIIIIPFIYYDFIHISTTLALGRAGQDTYSFNGSIIDLIADMHRLLIFLVLIMIKDKKRIFDMFFGAVIVYLVFRMTATGERGLDLITISLMILLRHYLVRPIKFANALLLVVFALFMLALLQVIAMTRFEVNKDLISVFKEVAQDNFILETIFSFGIDIWNGLMVFVAVPATGSFRFGTTYLAALIAKPMAILGNSSLQNYADYSFFLKDSGRGSLINSLTNAMGGSFTGELWFNFGWLSLLIAPLLGYLVKCLDIRLMNLNSENNPIKMAWCYYMAMWFIWWIRAYFPAMIWYFEFYGAVSICLYILVRNIRARL